MLDALITDFDGVVVDSEPMHFRGFAEVLASEGIALTWDTYASTYMALDDRDCFRAVAADHGVTLSEERLAAMIDAKSVLVQELMTRDIRAYPGVVDLLAACAHMDIPLGICTGCLRAEVELCSRMIGIWDHVQVTVAAQDVTRGKPDPEGYTQAMKRLRDITGRDLQAGRCIVMEDSPGGVAAAKDAGMKVLAITNSHPAHALTQADRVVDSLEGVTPEILSNWFSGGGPR